MLNRSDNINPADTAEAIAADANTALASVVNKFVELGKGEYGATVDAAWFALFNNPRFYLTMSGFNRAPDELAKRGKGDLFAALMAAGVHVVRDIAPAVMSRDDANRLSQGKKVTRTAELVNLAFSTVRWVVSQHKAELLKLANQDYDAAQIMFRDLVAAKGCDNIATLRAKITSGKKAAGEAKPKTLAERIAAMLDKPDAGYTGEDRINAIAVIVAELGDFDAGALDVDFTAMSQTFFNVATMFEKAALDKLEALDAATERLAA